MNKYAALGILLEAAEGKHIAVVVESHQASRFALYDFEIPKGDGWKVRQANGKEEITSPAGGRITFHSVRSSVRGMRFDSVFLDASVDHIAGLDFMTDLQYTLRPGASIIRA